jgi:hypothetical protein
VSRAELFEQRREDFARQEQTAQRLFNRYAAARVGVFLGSAVLVWLTYRQVGVPAAAVLSVLGLVGYLGLLGRHQAVRIRRDTFRFLKELNDDEAARLQGRFLRLETGTEFLDPAHPYAADLDVFGTHSLFRLLNRTRTHGGTRRLADWLRAPADRSTLFRRQQAVAELAPRLDFRQRTEATAMRFRTVGESPDGLLAWVRTTDETLFRPIFKIIRWLPLLTISLLVTGWIGIVPSVWGWVLLGVQAGAVLRVGRVVKATVATTNSALGPLRAYAEVLTHLEAEPFESEALRHIGQNLSGASAHVRTLSRNLDLLSYRQNPYFYLFVGLVTSWDLHFGTRVETWKRQHRDDLPRWLDALAEYEALHSLAGLACAEPGYRFPTLAPEPLIVEAQHLGHPLLPAERRVTNSVSLIGTGQTALITGSNMAGKSTFLRTVGVNVVLALTGSVVAAESFACSVVRVFTSMRTQDSLAESTSSFYAELRRLRYLLDLTGVPVAPPVLYFLDEILKGTNSKDRHAGARALIRQLHQTAASGFVSTHDVELGEEATAWPFVQNFSFQSEVIGGELRFDYRLRPGVCHSFNASELMRQMGIALP